MVSIPVQKTLQMSLVIPLAKILKNGFPVWRLWALVHSLIYCQISLWKDLTCLAPSRSEWDRLPPCTIVSIEDYTFSTLSVWYGRWFSFFFPFVKLLVICILNMFSCFSFSSFFIFGLAFYILIHFICYF